MAARASYANQTNLFNTNCENGNIICDSDRQFGQSYKGVTSLKSLQLSKNKVLKANGHLQLAVILDALADSIANKMPYKHLANWDCVTF